VNTQTFNKDLLTAMLLLYIASCNVHYVLLFSMWVIERKSISLAQIVNVMFNRRQSRRPCWNNRRVLYEEKKCDTLQTV